MTEAEWLAATDPIPLLGFLRGKMNDRKLRLFACGVCRRLAPFAETEDYIRGVELAESYADGIGTKAAMRRHKQTLNNRNCTLSMGPNYNERASEECKVLFMAVAALSEKDFRTFPIYLSDLKADVGSKSIRDAISSTFVLVRDIFGNPFHSVAIDPSWLTSTVLTLTQGIYSDKAFDRMPILADALQDAGCDNEDILNHCRQPGEHCRGCWCVDLILDKQ